ncbi:MAG: fibronectin type III domain-containing protein, partial [Oscillospiraceae bacterium]|nr:fibronectin type III domain-containing protein [Oscillospiraceae bacterium]
GYQIWRQNADGSWSVVKTLGDRGNTLTNDQGDVTAYSNTGLTAGGKYTYKMRAFYISPEGGKIYGTYSDEITVSVMPEAPDLTVTSPKAQRAQVKWTMDSAADGYQVWMSEKESSGFSIVKSVTGGDILSYTKSGLESGKTYYFKVRAYSEVDGKKTFGAYSETIAITVK